MRECLRKDEIKILDVVTERKKGKRSAVLPVWAADNKAILCRSARHYPAVPPHVFGADLLRTTEQRKKLNRHVQRHWSYDSSWKVCILLQSQRLHTHILLSGTNGYVVRNLSHLRPRDGQQDMHKFDQGPPKHREPDAGILEHERLRKIEVRCLELQLELEENG